MKVRDRVDVWGLSSSATRAAWRAVMLLSVEGHAEFGVFDPSERAQSMHFASKRQARGRPGFNLTKRPASIGCRRSCRVVEREGDSSERAAQAMHFPKGTRSSLQADEPGRGCLRHADKEGWKLYMPANTLGMHEAHVRQRGGIR